MTDPVLVLLVPTVAGVFALVGSWLGSRLGRKSEYEKWLREQKQQAYSEFLGAFDALYLETGRPDIDNDSVQQTLFSLVTKQSRISVVGPSHVIALSNRLVDETWETVQAARGAGPNVRSRYELRSRAQAAAKDVIDAIRTDLGVTRVLNTL